VSALNQYSCLAVGSEGKQADSSVLTCQSDSQHLGLSEYETRIHVSSLQKVLLKVES